MHRNLIPDDDASRLQLLREFCCAYAPREERFDRITRLTRKLLDVPMTGISIVDEYEQWFLSEQGFNTSRARRDVSMCNEVMCMREILCVQDTLHDERYANYPQVLGPPFVRAYMGVPLELETGLFVGALCVADTTPRQFSQDEILSLRDLAAIVVAEIRQQPMHNLGANFVRSLGQETRSELLDSLTGCWNFAGQNHILKCLDDTPTAGHLSLVALRIKEFAKLQAFFGSKTDLLLSSYAQKMRGTYSEQAVFCRPAPDQFLIINQHKSSSSQNGLLPFGSQMRVQEQSFEILMPSFPRLIEVPTRAATQHLTIKPKSGIGAVQAWQQLAAAI